MKNSYKNNKIKISSTTWSEKFDLPDGSYPVPGIQDYFEYTIKKHEKFTDNPPIRIFVNKKENRTTFKTYRGYISNFQLLKQWNYLDALKVR